MAKTVIKEIIITLLLCLAIILVLGILLYEYVPMSKTVPTAVSYATPENVKKELATTDNVEDEVFQTSYEITAQDLTNYKRVQDYKPGKANPFSSYESQSSGSNTTNNGSSSGSSSNGGTSSNETNNGNSSNSGTNTNTSGGNFFPDKGTK